jgi:hypothetical protein
MKTLITVAFILFSTEIAFAQTDSVGIINAEYSKYIYNPQTNSPNLSYNYSNKWDFEGDKRKDSLFFIGNGGAHSYFYLRIILSSDGLPRDFSSIQIDMPYFPSIETLKKMGPNPAVRFIVNDFNNDGTQDIYLNFNNPFGSISKAWKNKGIKTKSVIMSFAGNKISVKDYQ